jgi:hypothetical protein
LCSKALYFCLQLGDVLLHVDPEAPDSITVKLLCGWAGGEDGLFSPSNVKLCGGMPDYKAPEVRLVLHPAASPCTLLQRLFSLRVVQPNSVPQLQSICIWCLSCT